MRGLSGGGSSYRVSTNKKDKFSSRNDASDEPQPSEKCSRRRDDAVSVGSLFLPKFREEEEEEEGVVWGGVILNL